MGTRCTRECNRSQCNNRGKRWLVAFVSGAIACHHWIASYSRVGFVLGPRLLHVSAFKKQHTQAVAPRRVSGSQEEAFDRDAFMQREEFDPLSLSSFRRDALLQYRNTNQSEPLRIGIFLLVALAGTCFPFFAPVNAGIQYYVAAVAVAAVGGFLFLREREKKDEAASEAAARVRNG